MARQELLCLCETMGVIFVASHQVTSVAQVGDASCSNRRRQSKHTERRVSWSVRQSLALLFNIIQTARLTCVCIVTYLFPPLTLPLFSHYHSEESGIGTILVLFCVCCIYFFFHLISRTRIHPVLRRRESTHSSLALSHKSCMKLCIH